jgi:TPR repeat protein
VFGINKKEAIMSLWDNFKKAKNKTDYEHEFLETKSLAEQGDAKAQNELGIMYEKGKGVAKDYTEAWKWYSLAVKQRHTGAVDNRINLAHAERVNENETLPCNI